LLLLAVAAEEVARVTSALLTRRGAGGNLHLSLVSSATYEKAIDPSEPRPAVRYLHTLAHSRAGHRTDGHRIPDQAA
jgi:hypothetical protein